MISFILQIIIESLLLCSGEPSPLPAHHGRCFCELELLICLAVPCREAEMQPSQDKLYYLLVAHMHVSTGGPLHLSCTLESHESLADCNDFVTHAFMVRFWKAVPPPGGGGGVFPSISTMPSCAKKGSLLACL